MPPPQLEAKDLRCSMDPESWSQSILSKVDSLQKDGSVVDSNLRRSKRQKALNKGYKNSTCSVKGCLGCTLNPPILSPSTIKNLGSSFCKLDPNLLSEENLGQPSLKKKSAPSPSGKKPSKKKSSINDDESEDEKTKK